MRGAMRKLRRRSSTLCSAPPQVWSVECGSGQQGALLVKAMHENSPGLPWCWALAHVLETLLKRKVPAAPEVRGRGARAQAQRNKLDERMMQNVRQARREADAVLAIVDAAAQPRAALKVLLPAEGRPGPPLAVVLNKVGLGLLAPAHSSERCP